MSLPKFEDTRTAFEGLKSSLSFVDILLAGDIDAKRVMACFSFLFHKPGKKKVHFSVFFGGGPAGTSTASSNSAVLRNSVQGQLTVPQ